MGDKLNLNYYMVAFIDFMGQKSSLAELAKRELDDVQQNDVNDAFHEHMARTF